MDITRVFSTAIQHHPPMTGFRYCSRRTQQHVNLHSYTDNRHPVIFAIDESPSVPTIQVPFTRVPRDRPRKERIRGGNRVPKAQAQNPAIHDPYNSGD